MILGKLLKSEIKRKNYTQKQFAKMIGVCEGTLCNILSGKNSPGPRTLHNICFYLGIELHYKAVRLYEPQATISFEEFVKTWKHILKYNTYGSNKGKILMNYLSIIWKDEYTKITNDYYNKSNINCIYSDTFIDNTLRHLKRKWNYSSTF